MFDFDFLSRFDEWTFRANLATNNGTGGAGRTSAAGNGKQRVSPNWYEEMLRKIQEAHSPQPEGKGDAVSVNGATSANNDTSAGNSTRTNSGTSANSATGTGNGTQRATGATGRSGSAAVARADNPEADRRIRNMSLQEYGDYIADRISTFRVSSTRAAGSQAVQISDEGLSAMQDDPEYEAWVLDSIERDLFAYDPWSRSGGMYKVDYYGAHKSDYHSWMNYGDMRDADAREVFAEKSKGAIWSRGSAAKAGTGRSAAYNGAEQGEWNRTTDAERAARQRESEAEKQQLMMEYYNALRSNPFAAETSSSMLDAYLAAAGGRDDASDAWREYALRNMGGGLF